MKKKFFRGKSSTWIGGTGVLLLLLLCLGNFLAYWWLKVVGRVHEGWHQRFKHVIQDEAPGYQSSIEYLFRFSAGLSLSTGLASMAALFLILWGRRTKSGR